MYRYTVSDTLGERLKSLRKSNGFSAAQLGARVGISENAVYKLEAGITGEPSFAVGLKIARTLGVHPETIAFGASLPADSAMPPLSNLEARMERLEQTLTQALRVGAIQSEAVALALEQDHEAPALPRGNTRQPSSLGRKAK